MSIRTVPLAASRPTETPRRPPIWLLVLLAVVVSAVHMVLGAALLVLASIVWAHRLIRADRLRISR